MLNITNLRNQLSYCPDTGVFTWRESGSGRRADLIAGCVKEKAGNVWRRIVFEQQEYTADQLAWVFMTGVFPDFIIDHIDQDPLNDTWINLRRGDQGIDQRNQKKSRRNTSGSSGTKPLVNITPLSGSGAESKNTSAVPPTSLKRFVYENGLKSTIDTVLFTGSNLFDFFAVFLCCCAIISLHTHR